MKVLPNSLFTGINLTRHILNFLHTILTQLLQSQQMTLFELTNNLTELLYPLGVNVLYYSLVCFPLPLSLFFYVIFVFFFFFVEER